MDPVTIISLVAACASLAGRCASSVKLLHSLVGSCKHSEVSILSVAEECETIQFAWSRIEAWANQNLHYLDNFSHLRDRLQKSIYTCQLVVSALEEDIAKVNSKSKFRRQASLIWYEELFQDHRTRITGQVSCLQLLLQAMNMPYYEDRIKALSVKEHVFQEADESVLSIVPSHASTRLSITDSYGKPLQRVVSTKLQYIGMSFENDLFTSNVYKRDYRLPFMQRGSSSMSLKSVDQRVDQQRSRLLRSSRSIVPIPEIPEEQTASIETGSLNDTQASIHYVELQRYSKTSETSQATILYLQSQDMTKRTTNKHSIPEPDKPSGPTNGIPAIRLKLEKSLRLPFRDGVDIPQHSGRNEVLERRLTIYLNDNRHEDAAKLLQTDLDIALIFDE